MKHSRTVIKNSFWLMLQPLALNIVSLFVIGYIARTLGKVNYGIFNFAFAFVAIFTPFVNLGLGSLATREIAENGDGAPSYIGKLLNLRFSIGVVIYATLILSAHILHYPLLTKMVIGIAGLNILFNALASTFNSAFQGIQRMEYIASVQFISGLLLTVFSVLVLYLGYNLYCLTSVYALGSFLSVVISFILIKRLIGIKEFHFDMTFWKVNISRGIPLFIPAFMTIISAKLGIVILERFSGPGAVGIFSAANNLTEKLLVIPDGICTAIFPSLAVLYQTSRQDAEILFKRFFSYLFIIGLPIAIGTTIIAKPIIHVIYGATYTQAVLTLKLLSWALFLSFLNSILGWSLGAIHQEKRNARVSIIIAALSVLLNLIFIPLYQTNGLCISIIITQIITFFLLGNLIVKHLATSARHYGKYLKIILANIVMFLAAYKFRDNLYISTVIASIVYCIMLFALKLVTQADIAKLSTLFLKKKLA